MAFYIVPYFRKKENHLFLKSDIYKAKHAAVHRAISHTERKPWRIAKLLGILAVFGIERYAKTAMDGMLILTEFPRL